jgi:hypothetical protein
MTVSQSSYRPLFASILVLVLATANAQAEAPVEKIVLGTALTMTPPTEWESVPPKSNMIQSEFKAPREQKEDTARVTVMSASGGIDANIDRWIGQFDGAKKEEAKIEKMDVAGATVHMVDIAGTFKDSMGGGPFAPGPMKKRENYRMIGAIVETKNDGLIFIKMTGPKTTVESLAEGFKKSLTNLEKK